MNLRRLFNVFCDFNLNISNDRLRIPFFNINSSNIYIIKHPTEFYNTLKVCCYIFLRIEILFSIFRIWLQKVKGESVYRRCTWEPANWKRTWFVNLILFDQLSLFFFYFSYLGSRVFYRQSKMSKS